MSNDSLVSKGMELWNRISWKNQVEKAVFLKGLGYLPNTLDSLKQYSLEDSPLGTAAAEGIITVFSAQDSFKQIDSEGLIKAEKIDSVSSMLNKDFNSLMDIELKVHV